MGTFKYTSGALAVLAGGRLVGEPVVLELPVGGAEVRGGVEAEALAPACAATCNAPVNESKNVNITRQAIGVAICSQEANV